MDVSTILLLAVICLTIGFFLGRLSASLGADSSDGVSAEEPVSGDRLDMVSVWRDRNTQGLEVNFEGKIFNWSVDLKPKQRDRLNQIVRDLHKWLNPLETGDQASLSDQVGSSEASDDQRSPGFLKPVDVLTTALQADIPKSTSAPQSIAAQIDAVLQEKLAESSLRGQPIRLMELPNKGMVVMVGLDQYEGIDNVPDEEIKTLIKSAVAEWEQRVEKPDD